MIETSPDIHEGESYSGLDNGIKKYKEELFNYIDGLSAGDFVRFIDSLGSIDYDDKVLSEGGCINVKLKILQKKEVAAENGKIGTDNEDVTGINKEETKKAYDFVLKIPVGEKIVKKYHGGKNLSKIICKEESGILFTLGAFMNGLDPTSEDINVQRSDKIHLDFCEHHLGLRSCIETFLKSHSSDFCYRTCDGIEVEVHPIEYKGGVNSVADLSFSGNLLRK